MLWLGRPRAGREVALEIVNDDGELCVVVLLRTDDGQLTLEVRRIEDKDNPRVRLLVI